MEHACRKLRTSTSQSSALASIAAPDASKLSRRRSSARLAAASKVVPAGSPQSNSSHPFRAPTAESGDQPTASPLASGPRTGSLRRSARLSGSLIHPSEEHSSTVQQGSHSEASVSDVSSFANSTFSYADSRAGSTAPTTPLSNTSPFEAFADVTADPACDDTRRISRKRKASLSQRAAPSKKQSQAAFVAADSFPRATYNFRPRIPSEAMSAARAQTTGERPTASAAAALGSATAARAKKARTSRAAGASRSKRALRSAAVRDSCADDMNLDSGSIQDAGRASDAVLGDVVSDHSGSGSSSHAVKRSNASISSIRDSGLNETNANDGNVHHLNTVVAKTCTATKKSDATDTAGEDDLGEGNDIDDVEQEDHDQDDDEEDESGEDDEEDDDEYAAGGDHDDDGFGMNLRAMAGFLSGLSRRFKTILSSLRNRFDPAERLVALQELSEVLSVSSEDSLAGYFPTESFVKELIALLGGNPSDASIESGVVAPDSDVAAALAAADAADAGDNTEIMLLAARCLTNLMEAMPYATHSVVTNGAIPLLNSKLMFIEFIDLAEQVLQTLEKISVDYPNAIVEEGGLMAMLQYIDFFNIHVQRTAMNAVSNCCRKLNSDNFDKVKDAMSQIQGMLASPDRRLKESAVRSVVRIIDSYKAFPEILETLITEDVCAATKFVLEPSAGSNGSSGAIISTSMYTDLVKALCNASKATPQITAHLLQSGIGATLYCILTGSKAADTGNLVSADPLSKPDETIGNVSISGQSPVVKMTLLQNLSTKPKEQIQEALTLVCELLPPLPWTDIFDQRNYSEKALKRKKHELAKREGVAKGRNSLEPPTANSQMESSEDTVEAAPTSQASQIKKEYRKGSKEAAAQVAHARRLEMLNEQKDRLLKLSAMILPALVDIHTASITPSIRSKAMTAILKILAFADASQLEGLLRSVPMSTFVAGVLSSKDSPTVIQGSLQVVELLLTKLGHIYCALLEREGVMWEVKQLAKQPVSDTGMSNKAIGLPADTLSTESQNTDDSPASEAPKLGTVGNSGLRQVKDANVLRARMVHLVFGRHKQKTPNNTESSTADSLERASGLAQQIASGSFESEGAAASCLHSAFALLQSNGEGLSGFEVVKSGLINALLIFLNADSDASLASRRKGLLRDTMKFMPESSRNLIQRLQESLSRLERVEMVSVAGSLDDEHRRSPAAALSKQIRLRLVADDPDGIPKSCNNIIVSIHAVASFGSLHDFLRPKIALGNSLIGPGTSRLSSVLAAFAAAAQGQESPREPTRNTNSLTSDGASTATATESVEAHTRGVASGQNSGSTTHPGQVTSDEQADKTLQREQGLLRGESASLADALMQNLMHDDMDPLDEDLEELDIIEREISPPESGDPSARQLPGSRAEEQETNVSAPDTANTSTAEPNSQTKLASYSEAVQKPATDWHLAFSVDGEDVGLPETIFSAIYRAEKRKNASFSFERTIWQNLVTVRFRKVPGTRARDHEEIYGIAAEKQPAVSSIFPEDSTELKILRLLEVLYHAMSSLSRHSSQSGIRHLDTSLFINNKLTAKLNRQLEEPLIVASTSLPDWAVGLPLEYPFLFPFETRFSFLQSTSFGYARLIARWQLLHRGSDNGRNEDSFGFLSRLQRQKVRISRRRLLDSAVKIFDLYASNSSILEVEYFDEVGTGLGPTLEFYSLVSQDFALKENNIWLDEQTNPQSLHVSAAHGLYPIPISSSASTTLEGSKRLGLFRTLGTFVAKALLDSRIVQIDFSRLFISAILGRKVAYNLDTLAQVDGGLASSLKAIQSVAPEDVATLHLDFTLPGDSNYELVPGGSDKKVSGNNVNDYISAVIDAYLDSGIQPVVESFRAGFEKVFMLSSLKPFTADELVLLFGNSQEDWSAETLLSNIKPDHGFTPESEPYRNLLSIMQDFTDQERRTFLQWLTGSPKLPIGGFKALHPQLTVVKRPHEAPLKPDDYLPSVMTCVNYLKLPSYSGKEVMRQRLNTAMLEGGTAFHLS